MRRLSLLLALTMFVASPANAVSAAADPVPGGFATWEALYLEQDRLNGAANLLHLPGEEGFAGIEVAPENHEVRLYWQGRPTAAAETALAASRLRAPVRLIAAPFSQTQMLAEAQRWLASGKVHAAGPKADGTGLLVSALPSAVLSLPGQTMPIEAEFGEPATPAASRQDDESPYYSGALYINWRTGGSCTLGFAITDLSGNDALLTAAHCGRYGDTVVDGGRDLGEDYLGYFWFSNPGSDVAAVMSVDENGIEPTGPYMYSGGWTSSAARGVAKAQRTYQGNWIGTSGSMTGEHTGIQIKRVNQFVLQKDGLTVGPVATGEQYQRTCASAQGDSGGPAFAYFSSTDPRVLAHGIISSGYDTSAPASCPGGNPRGTWRVNIVDIYDALGPFWTVKTTA